MFVAARGVGGKYQILKIGRSFTAAVLLLGMENHVILLAEVAYFFQNVCLCVIWVRVVMTLGCYDIDARTGRSKNMIASISGGTRRRGASGEGGRATEGNGGGGDRAPICGELGAPICGPHKLVCWINPPYHT